MDQFQWSGRRFAERVFFSGETVNMIEDRDQLESAYPRISELLSAMCMMLEAVQVGSYRMPPFYKFPLHSSQLLNSFRRTANAVSTLYGDGNLYLSKGIEILTMRNDKELCFHDALHITDRRYGVGMVIFGDPCRRASCVMYRYEGVDSNSVLDFASTCNTSAELARSLMEGVFGNITPVVSTELVSSAKELVIDVDCNRSYRYPVNTSEHGSV